MRTSAARVEHSVEQVLFVVFELSNKSWKLGFATNLGQRIRERTGPRPSFRTLRDWVFFARLHEAGVAPLDTYLGSLVISLQLKLWLEIGAG